MEFNYRKNCFFFWEEREQFSNTIMLIMEGPLIHSKFNSVRLYTFSIPIELISHLGHWRLDLRSIETRDWRWKVWQFSWTRYISTFNRNESKEGMLRLIFILFFWNFILNYHDGILYCCFLSFPSLPIPLSSKCLKF